MEAHIVQKLTSKIKSMGKLYPEGELHDFEWLNNNLLSYKDLLPNIILSDFFPIIEYSSPEYLQIFGELCINNDFGNFADLLIKYCFSQNLIGRDIESEWNLLYTIIKIIVHFELNMYIDAEIESERVKLHFDAYEFSVNINKIPSSESLEILRLLHTLYAHKIIDESSPSAPEKQAIFISKYNNIVSIIRAMDKKRLRESRWARLYASEGLEYSSETKSLFRAKDAAQHDDMLWKQYNILLIPAFGEIKIDKETIMISNEGKGCIQNPTLEIWHDSNKVLEIPTIALVPAGKVCHFKLNVKGIKRLNSLNPNNRLVSLHLLFHKFNNNTSFKLIRQIEIRDLLENLPTSISTDTLHIQNGQEFTQLDFEQKGMLVDALLACPAISDKDKRDTVVDNLDNKIKDKLKRNSTDRFDVLNIVNTCLNYSEGLQQLIKIVRYFESDSLSMQKLEKVYAQS